MNITNPTAQDTRFARKIIDERIEKEKKHIEIENEKKHIEIENEKKHIENEKKHIENEKKRIENNLTNAYEIIGSLKTQKVSRNFDLFHPTTV
jgi:uncharacterized protein (DUF3084 family)